MLKHTRRSLLILAIASVSAVNARAQFPTTRPFTPVTYIREQRVNPNMDLHIVTIDLTDPNVSIRVAPGGPDPDGDGPAQTTLMTVREIAEREKFDIAINASFFMVHPAAATTRPVPAPTTGPTAMQGLSRLLPAAPGAKYPPQAPASCIGLTMTDRRLWSRSPRTDAPVLWIDDVRDGRDVHIETLTAPPADAVQIVSGNTYVLKDAGPVAAQGMMNDRHPRTVVGIDRDAKKLVLLTVDGRRPWSSIGMTGPELTAEMQRLGCHTALNLDGGGSTTLVMRDPETNEIKVLNTPSDGRERPVGSVIGITLGNN